MVLYSASRRLSSAALSAASDALPSPGSTRMAAPDGSPASGSCKCRTIFGRQHRDAAGLVVRHRSPGRGCCDSLCRGELFEEPSTAFAPLAIRPPGAPSAPRPPCSSVHCCVPASHFQNTLNDVSIRTMNNKFSAGQKRGCPAALRSASFGAGGPSPGLPRRASTPRAGHLKGGHLFPLDWPPGRRRKRAHGAWSGCACRKKPRHPTTCGGTSREARSVSQRRDVFDGDPTVGRVLTKAVPSPIITGVRSYSRAGRARVAQQEPTSSHQRGRLQRRRLRARCRPPAAARSRARPWSPGTP